MSDPDKIRNRGLAEAPTHDDQKLLTDEHEDDRDEKPRQQVPSTLLILVLGVYILLACLAQRVENKMPAVVREADVTADNSDIFSEEVAWRYLDRIIGSEPRVAGTKYHLAQTKDLKAMVDDIAAQANQVVRTDWQMASGDFFRESTKKPSFFSVYQNASNVAALLEGESGFHPNGTLRSSLLVNCHYDSVPFALGASDNAVFCAIMAEVLTKLSRSKQKLKRNIVFLFNGAEENGLQASHAFLQHPWAKGASVVINLDAAGMNGKPSLFQVTDPRVLNAYHRSVATPNAQGVSQFLFSSGFIPSDTDFRIWRDFGHMTGVDIAFVKWALVYHTRNDKPELILPGVLQSAGDMLLALVAATANVGDLDEPIEPTAAVYYDYLNLFLVTYSFPVSYAVDVFIALLGLASVGYYVWIVGARWSTVKSLLFTVLGRLAIALVGVIVVAVCLLFMIATTVQMRYLAKPWLVVPLYWMPYLLVAVATAQVFDAWTLKKTGLSRSLRCQQAMSATRLLMSLILLALVLVPSLISLRYLISAPLFIVSIASLISLTVARHVTLKGWQHLLLEISLSLPTLMFLFSLALRVNAQMLPVLNRSPNNNKPDVTAAVLNAGLAVLVSCTVSGVELLFSRKRLWMVLSVLGGICAMLMVTPFSPYDYGEGISVSRQKWFHSEIVAYDINHNTISRTSGIVVTKQDPYTISRARAALYDAGYMNVSTDVSADCETQVFCGLPLFRATFSPSLKSAMLVYTDPPAPFSPPPSVTVRSRKCAGDECRYRFFVTAAQHNMITLWPRDNITVSSWSLNSSPRVCFQQLNRPVYVIYYSAATYNEQGVEFTLDVVFKVPPSLQTQPIVDLSHHAHKIYHPEDFTPKYNSILQAMPPYFNMASFLSFRHDYVF